MTLTSETTRVQYAGDGAQTTFPITFIFWLDSDVEAIHTDANGTETVWTEGVHYNLTGGAGSTGRLTVKTVPTDYTPVLGTTLTIKSNLPNTQGTSLPEGGAFPSSSVEQQMDKLARMIQQMRESVGRAIKLAVSATETDLDMPAPDAGKTLRWKADETGLENVDIASGGELTTPVAIAEGGTGSTTASAAREALGLGRALTAQRFALHNLA